MNDIPDSMLGMDSQQASVQESIDQPSLIWLKEENAPELNLGFLMIIPDTSSAAPMSDSPYKWK